MTQKTLKKHPPSSNRGGKPGNPQPLDLALDWLAFTCDGEKYTEIWEIVAQFFPLKLSAKNPCPARGYRQVTEFQDGPKLSQSDDRKEVHIQFSGSVMRLICLGEQVAMLRKFLAIGAKPTRIDPRIDDFRDEKLLPQKLVDWASQGYLCRFKVWQPIQKFKGTKSLGLTFAAGRRGDSGSGCYMRVYEWYFGKNQEKCNGRKENGEIDAVRFEAELTGHKAVQFAERLAQSGSYEDIATRITECIYGSIDFREGSKSSGFRDRKRIKEWADYIQEIPVYKYQKPKRNMSESFPIAAFTLQWGGKLAQLCQNSGSNTFSRIIRDAINDGQKRGYGVAVPFEKLVSITESLEKILENLSHTRRQIAFRESIST